jgi:hypothetical protein
VAKRILPFTIALALIAGGAGCSLRSVATSVPPRIFREVDGLRAPRIVFSNGRGKEFLA